MNKLRNTKGMTLISLVITIIILIILAGVTINLSLGENGLFASVKEAKDKYLASAEDEQRALNELYKELGIENLPENTPENQQEIGIEVALKDGWGQETVTYTNTKNGVEVTGLTKVATVYAVSVGNGDTVPVPKGFYYVGGTLENGVIISDNADDRYQYNPETKKEKDTSLDKTTYEYTRNLKGNQFVWIPCSTSGYKKSDTWNEKKQTNTSLGSTWWDTTTPKAELSQIEKYGGFYIARYEAGLASTISEFDETQIHTGSNQIYNKEGVPQSKAGIAPWNFIDWNISKKNAESMYNNDYVSSGLITGTQWDVMLKKMVGKTIGETTGDSKITLTEADLANSSRWGNYRDTVLTYNGRLAKAQYSSDKWKLPVFGTETTNGTTVEYKSDNTYGDLLTTGASKMTQVYHIYDVAGNLWEWTEEDSNGATSGQYRVTRGGVFFNTSSTFPACYRRSAGVSYTGAHIGFRAVLYIK